MLVSEKYLDYNTGYTGVITALCNPDHYGVTRMATIPNIKFIPLTQGKHAIVDAEDYDFLMQWKWFFHNKGYATRWPKKEKIDAKIKRNPILMHRLILNTPKGFETDHINGDRLDNRKLNLRICTRSENRCNRMKNLDGTSIYKGIYWNKVRRKWQSQIGSNGIKIGLGCFSSQIEAAFAYDVAAKKYHGKFAKINNVDKEITNQKE